MRGGFDGISPLLTASIRLLEVVEKSAILGVDNALSIGGVLIVSSNCDEF